MTNLVLLRDYYVGLQCLNWQDGRCRYCFQMVDLEKIKEDEWEEIEKTKVVEIIVVCELCKIRHCQKHLFISEWYEKILSSKSKVSNQQTQNKEQ
jgi:hypothetical protein